ncbi:MAG: GTPase Era [Oscillospiraceae bacterium]|jgi:GTP-binding protein Era|nr:GTPase Era [Oscillospiraceae bacterium]
MKNTTESLKKSNVFAALAGKTNTGKSTLMNLLVGDKVAIVSEKPQTTRTRIHGIITRDETQFVLIDTPGFHNAKNKLSEHMLKSARSGAAGADVILMTADCTKKISQAELMLIESLKPLGTDVILLLNKIDLMKDKTKLLALIEEYTKLHDFAEIIPISAKNAINTEKILPAMQKYAVETESGEHYFPGDITTDQAEKAWLAEIIREKVLLSMFEEIPHGVAAEIETLEETKTNSGKPLIEISVVIICEKASHKGMIIGKQGANLKKVGSAARLEMEEYFKSKVNMKLWVKVKENWRNKEGFIADLGLNSDA